MINFWEKFRANSEPFFALAPMEAVTDVVFRETVAESFQIAKKPEIAPPIFFTEFTNAASFASEKGEFSTRGRLTFSPDEVAGNHENAADFCANFPDAQAQDFDERRFLVAQIWGTKPADFRAMTAELFARGFSGVDLNMGCPDKNVVHHGAGSGLTERPELAVELIRAAQNGWLDFAKKRIAEDENFAQEFSKNLSVIAKKIAKIDSEKLRENLDTTRFPVSVKTRLGARKPDEFRGWLPKILAENPANLSIHLRTRKEMSKVPAHFELIPEILKLRANISPQTLLTVNGDISSRKQAQNLRAQNPKIDGFMIGRGVFNNPFVFADIEPTRAQLFELLRFQLRKYDEFREIVRIGDQILTRKFDPLKHFFKVYTNGFPGAKKLREEMMAAKTTIEVRKILDDFEKNSAD